MPPFRWLGDERIDILTQYMQSLGLKNADQRMERQRYMKKEAIKAYDDDEVPVGCVIVKDDRIHCSYISSCFR